MASKSIMLIGIVVIVVLAALALLLTQQQPQTTPTPTPSQTPVKTVVIGAALPLTGGLESYGRTAKVAVELAVEDANKLCQNMKFDVVVEDTATSPTQALSKIQAMYGRGIRLIVGPMSSGEVSAVKSFADTNRIIIFSPSSTSPLLAVPNDYVYRIVPSDAVQSIALAELLVKLGIKKVVMVFRNDAWGKGLSDALAREARARGIEVLAVEGYDPAPGAFPTAAPAAVEKVARAVGAPAPDVAFVIISFEDDGLIVMKSAAANPVLSRVRWIGTDGFAYSKSLIEQVGREMASVKLLGTVTAPDPKDPKYVEFKERFKAKAGVEPKAYDPYAYDAAMMLMRIVCELGTDDPVKVRETLERWGREGTYKGVTGVVYLDEAGDRAYANYVIWGVVLKDGKPQYVDAGYFYGVERRIEVFDEGRELFR
ncbi:MAG: ABC transporter substrate-binding protein [Pyrobaculum sp.]